MRVDRTPVELPTRSWWQILAGLAAIRIAIPLAALAASGRDLPGLPAYTYSPLNGDSFGFYAAAREFIATFGRTHPAILAASALAGLAGVACAAYVWRRDRRWIAFVVAAAPLAFSLAIVVHEMRLTGAAVLGWSLVWALPMLPYRAGGLPLDPDTAFVFGLTISLIANAVTVVATGLIGLYAAGRRRVGVTAATLFAMWPLLAPIVAGPSAWENGQWNADVGLHLYTEPLSTALVSTSLALLLARRVDDLRLVFAGTLLGYATLTKLSNGFIAAAAVVLIAACLGARRTMPLIAGGLLSLPLLVTYWPQGYPAIDYVPSWGPEFIVRNWADSLMFDPGVVAVFGLLALAGAVVLGATRATVLLTLVILVTAATYSFYEVTWLHPRFLYVALPPLFVLVATSFVAALQLWLTPTRGRGK